MRSFVVRRHWVGPPRADGVTDFVSYYIAFARGVSRLSPRLTRHMCCIDSATGAALGDEPGVCYE